MTTNDTFERIGLEALPDLERASAETLLAWALDKFSPQIALACSFQAEESVLIDSKPRGRWRGATSCCESRGGCITMHSDMAPRWSISDCSGKGFLMLKRQRC